GSRARAQQLRRKLGSRRELPENQAMTLAPRLRDHTAAIAHLTSVEPRLAALIERVGPCRLGANGTVHGEHGAFIALAEAVVSQQLSIKAADTIFGRVKALGPNGEFPSPAELLAIPETSLRGAGLSNAKAASVRDLAKRVHAGELRLAEIEALED